MSSTNEDMRAWRTTAGLKGRHRRERLFRLAGLAAVCVGVIFLGTLFTAIAAKGVSAFQRTLIQIDVYFDPEVIDPEGTRDPEALSGADYQGLVKKALRAAFPEVKGRAEKRELYALVSSGAAFALRERVLETPGIIGLTGAVWVPVSDDVDMIAKDVISRAAPAKVRRLSERQLGYIESLISRRRMETRFNAAFFTSGDSREPELAGVAAALAGSFFSLLVCLALSFPLGVMAAAYLEEFAPRNRWTAFIEVNINNLAAVPSIVFGLLGLAVFLNLFALPRSAPLVGGMVLALMTLPTIIIAGRASLKAVPPSIREAALAVGASPVQAVFHHVLPLAMPGVLTGTIIGMSRALGETAPLLMIGMVAFIVDIPKSILDPATTLPVQVFLWADSPERAFEEKTAAAVIILLGFLLAMNLLAVVMRKRFEIRW